MSINTEINRLLNFAISHNLINEEDLYYACNRLLDVLQVSNFEKIEIKEQLDIATPILENMLDYAVANNIIEDTITQRDLFDTKIMDCVMPRPFEVVERFKTNYAISPKLATDEYYHLSIFSNYIREERIQKNIIWKSPTEYGDLDITINLSKPEKDPRDIAKAKNIQSSGYPKCLLCVENEGYAGNLNHPARQTHRLIPLTLNNRRWYLQYSPYTYYNEHCIVLNKEHVPMKVSRDTFENICDFVEKFPHYFIGSNADLPIVGGSILSHDHYQGGRYTFAMTNAPIEKEYFIKDYPEVKVGRVKWAMSTIRLQSENREQLISLADKILSLWREYSDENVDIISHTYGTPHNTITPIGRMRDGKLELDLVLRNNRTTKKHPLGIFHPHDEVHHIKKENIGLIEVMGLAVLPARLKEEMAEIKMQLLNNELDISHISSLEKHASWYKRLRENYPIITKENVDTIIRDEIGKVFAIVLTHAGVFKRDEQGIFAFDKFIKTVSI